MTIYTLYSASIELTRKCNAKCKHCIIDAGKPLEEELSKDRILTLIEEMNEEGCEYITFTGGEPLLCKELPLYLQKAKSLGMHNIVMTNAFLIDDYWINVFKLFEVTLGISLDGPDKETHDGIRGLNGIFDHFVNIIPKLVKAGIYIGVSTTVMQSNYDKLDKIRDLLIKLKVNSWQLQILKPCDRVENEEVISEEQYLKLAEKIVDYRKKYGKKITIMEADCIGYNSKLSPQLYITEWRGCECGLYSASISSNGDVRGCPNMNNSEGNVANTPLKEVWQNHNSFAYNRKPNVDNLKGFCNECEYKYICRGGCPTNPLTKNGSAYCLHKIETVGFDK